MEQSPSGPMAGRTVLVTGGTGGIGRATTLGLARMGAHLAITGRDRARTETAAGEVRAAGCGQVDAPADQPASRPARAQRPGARGHGLLERAGDGQNRLRRPPGSAVLLRLAGIQPVQAGQRPVHLRAGSYAATAAGRCRHRQCVASRRGQHLLRSRGPRQHPAAARPVRATLHEVPGPGCCHLGPPCFRSRARRGERRFLRQQQAPQILRNAATTRPLRHGSGR